MVMMTKIFQYITATALKDTVVKTVKVRNVLHLENGQKKISIISKRILNNYEHFLQTTTLFL